MHGNQHTDNPMNKGGFEKAHHKKATPSATGGVNLCPRLPVIRTKTKPPCGPVHEALGELTRERQAAASQAKNRKWNHTAERFRAQRETQALGRRECLLKTATHVPSHVPTPSRYCSHCNTLSGPSAVPAPNWIHTPPGATTQQGP